MSRFDQQLINDTFGPDSSGSPGRPSEYCGPGQKAAEFIAPLLGSRARNRENWIYARRHSLEDHERFMTLFREFRGGPAGLITVASASFTTE
jgi:hypothetical protein